ncbi:putative Atrial natriuretic peptide receptor 2 [Hypsibius exemplaris]|uniref:Atrial natriuretic peptide receptor 2 n=1 Tax=Hypsibius exemplaris TaxID=2072580 RepID=A0A1W0WBZ1_HYPEX|nr:putative Atrial natriuretic peptide receptor 2 [Hypsibius exemplaris]
MHQRLLCAFMIYFWLDLGSPFSVDIITLGFYGTSTSSSLSYTGPGIDTAVRDAKVTYRGVFNITHTVLRGAPGMDCLTISFDGDALMGKYFYNRQQHDMTVIIVPGCVEAPAINKLASQWNVLFITGATTYDSQRDKVQSPTWITTTPLNYPTISAFCWTLLKSYNWTTVYIASNAMSSPLYQGVAMALSRLLSQVSGIQHTVREFNSVKNPDYYDELLNEFRIMSRVCAFFGHAAELRKFLIQAVSKSMTNGDFIYIGLETFHNSLYGGLSWNTFDPNKDDMLRPALRSVLILTVAEPANKNITAVKMFEKEWIMLSSDRYNYTYGEHELVSPYVSSSYAAVAVFTKVLNETLALRDGFDPTDGRAFAQKFRNQTLTTVVGDVYLDSVGERHADLLVRAFHQDDDSSNMTLTDVKVLSASGSKLVRLQPIQWANGIGPPANEPPCGYVADPRSCLSRTHHTVLVAAILSCSFLIIILIVTLCVGLRLVTL